MQNGIILAKTEHIRHKGVKRTFSYRHFLFSIELLDLQSYNQFYPFLSINKMGLYSFNYQDHHILREHGLFGLEPHLQREFSKSLEDYSSIRIITNLKSFGYVFNPISVYILTPKPSPSKPSNDILHKNEYIYEVGNTFGEQKYYFSKEMIDSQPKNFYVSPFIEHHHQFKFNIKHNDDHINLRIHTEEDGGPILTANLHGKSIELNKKSIIYSMWYSPFINFKIIFLIHFQAFLLFLKGLKYYKKDQFPESQTNFYKL